jgi:hypothetical protein
MRQDARSAAPHSAKAYRTPRLTAYGSLARLTAAGASGSLEMVMMTMLTRRV